MPLTKATIKSTSNLKILTGEGEILYIDYRAFPAVRRNFNINNNKVSICFQNTGFETDTNAICFKFDTSAFRYAGFCFADNVEYGNLSSYEVKECMKKILNKGVLDLSDVKVIYSADDIILGSGEKYLLINKCANGVNANNSFYLTLQNTYSENCREDESGFVFDNVEEPEGCFEYEEEDEEGWGNIYEE